MTNVAWYVAVFPEWIRVAELMRETRGWQTVYFSTLAGTADEARRCFPRAILHDKLMAIKGVAPEGREDWPTRAVDAVELERLARYQPTFMRILDRLDMFGSFTYADRERLYLRQVSMWKAMLDEVNPDVAVFSNTPHGPADFAMYASCRERGIPVAIFSPTGLPGLSCVRSTIEGPPAQILEEYRGVLERLEPPRISPPVGAHLDSLRRGYGDARPWYMATDKGPASNQIDLSVSVALRLVTRVGKWPEYLRRLAGGNYGAPVPPLAQQLKLAGVPYEDSRLTPRAWARYKRRARRYRKELRSAYNSLAQSPSPADHRGSYVYLPLHYQPEATTSPDGGPYSNQLLIVRLIAEALPDGWELWVREHPSQFADRLFGEQGRCIQDYRDMMESPGVRLISHTVDPFQLIDHSAAVATATGTAGWEAVVRGRPVLAFGYAWYRGCEGVFAITDRESLSVAIDRISCGYVVDSRLVEKYVAAYESVGVRGDINRTDPTVTDWKTNARGIAESLVRFADYAPLP